MTIHYLLNHAQIRVIVKTTVRDYKYQMILYKVKEEPLILMVKRSES
jgi:hypothetical protein